MNDIYFIIFWIICISITRYIMNIFMRSVGDDYIFIAGMSILGPIALFILLLFFLIYPKYFLKEYKLKKQQQNILRLEKLRLDIEELQKVFNQ